MRSLLIHSKYGEIEGFIKEDHQAFLGIPYAKPPIGNLRFKRAQAFDSWEGVLKAYNYGPPAIQFDNGEFKGSEDCLTLNIQRPNEGEQLPVFVWIHGGGYNTGAASDPLYDGQAFVKKDIVFVSIQYRLNVFGFYDFSTYSNSEEFESNCGLSDQIMALRWISENIETFGGDPLRITIAGESAGGTSVETLVAAPSTQGLFQQAIIQSAIAEGVFTKTMARKNMDLFLEGMGWKEEDINKLMTMDPFEVLVGNTYIADHFQNRYPGIYLPSPVLDDLLPVRPIEAIKSGCAKNIKLIVGTTKHEGSMFVRKDKTVFPNDWSMVEEMFALNGHEENFETFKNYYNDLDMPMVKEIDSKFIQFATDYAFQVPAYRIAEAQKKMGSIWVYRYDFGYDKLLDNGWGAGHAFELPSVFNNADFHFSQFVFKDVEEIERSQVMSSIHEAWINFVISGKPNGLKWPQYKGYKSKICIFDRETSIAEINVQPLMDLWHGLEFY